MMPLANLTPYFNRKMTPLAQHDSPTHLMRSRLSKAMSALFKRSMNLGCESTSCGFGKSR